MPWKFLKQLKAKEATGGVRYYAVNVAPFPVLEGHCVSSAAEYLRSATDFVDGAVASSWTAVIDTVYPRLLLFRTRILNVPAVICTQES